MLKECQPSNFEQNESILRSLSIIINLQDMLSLPIVNQSLPIPQTFIQTLTKMKMTV
jgi:hypothetical protein